LDDECAKRSVLAAIVATYIDDVRTEIFTYARRYIRAGPHSAEFLHIIMPMEEIMELEISKRMDGADEWFSDGKMSLHSLLNGADTQDSSSTEVPNGGTMATLSTPPVPDEGDQCEGSTRTGMDTENELNRDLSLGESALQCYASLVQRPICSVCRVETGRCHASDPPTMQTFFVTTVGFEGVLSNADWLCMKCYSKWYNRCKRKASSTVLSSDALPPHPSTPRRKRSTSSVKQHATPTGVTGDSKEKEKEKEPDLRDVVENDDAMLLTRITTHTNPTTPINIPRDLETEVDDLRDEVHRVRGEVIRLSQELSKRDGQMEDMLKFVKNEIASMHVLLTEIAEAQLKTNTSQKHMVNNNVISIPSPPMPALSDSSSMVYIPPTIQRDAQGDSQ